MFSTEVSRDFLRLGLWKQVDGSSGVGNQKKTALADV